MSNWLEKSLHFGVGLFLYSREKVEELVEDLVNKGEVAQKDAREFAGELMKRGQEQKEEVKKFIRDETAQALDHLNVAKKDDLITREEIAAIVREQVQKALLEQGISSDEAK